MSLVEKNCLLLKEKRPVLICKQKRLQSVFQLSGSDCNFGSWKTQTHTFALKTNETKPWIALVLFILLLLTVFWATGHDELYLLMLQQSGKTQVLYEYREQYKMLSHVLVQETKESTVILHCVFVSPVFLTSKRVSENMFLTGPQATKILRTPLLFHPTDCIQLIQVINIRFFLPLHLLTNRKNMDLMERVQRSPSR